MKCYTLAWLIASTTLVVVGAAQAQTWRPAHLAGTVRDSAGAPVAGITVRIGIGPERRADSLGRYAFQKLPAGQWRLAVLCPSVTYFHAQRLTVHDVTLEPGAQVTQDATVDPTQCRPATVDTLRGEFCGHWSMGFEESQFVPCPHTIDSRRIVTQPGWGGIWAEWAPSATPTWPEPAPAPDTSGYGDRYYVAVLGYLHGPGDFGHMSVAAYQLDVERVLMIRTPGDGDCR